MQTVTFRKPPKLDKRGHKLDLIALSADMSQTDNKIILEQTLNDDVSVYSGEIKVNGQSVYHV